MTKTTQPNEFWARLQAVIDHSGIPSINAFALHIGLRRGENLYQIKKGNNAISLRLAERVCRHYPEISLGWLLSGEGKMLPERETAEEVLAKIKLLLKK